MKKLLYISVIVLVNNFNCIVQAGIIDQYQENYDGGFAFIHKSSSWGQTFTAGMSGQLEKIEVYLDHWYGEQFFSDYPTEFSIVSVANSVPNGTILGKVTIADFSIGFNSIDFLSEHIILSSGTQYGIVIYNDEPIDGANAPYCSIQLRLNDNDVYAGGSLWNWQPDIGWSQDSMLPVFDLSKMETVFRTYMVPEPGMMLLMGMGVMILRKKR